MSNDIEKYTLTKAVFPVAGMGTRFLPATKANPKEMLPIVDKPLIQYAVEEAIRAGLTELIFVTSGSKRTIEDHFDSNYELEAKLEARQKLELLHIVQSIIPKGVHCAYVRQHEALGLGHAILCAQSWVGNEPFAVLLADDLIDTAPEFGLTEMVQYFKRTGQPLVAVQPVARSQADRYGIIGVEDENIQWSKITTLVEKPKLVEAPSCLAAIGRYILSPHIFQALEPLHQGHGGEVQLTDAIATLLKTESIHAYQLKGTRYDCGDKLGYLKATMAYALKHPEIGESFQAYLDTFMHQ